METKPVTEPLVHYQAPVNDRTSRTDDERIKNIMPLPPPEHLIKFFPIQGTPVEELVSTTRHRIQDIMGGRDDRLLVIIGPCSIHDPAAAVDYARKLKALRDRHAGELEIVLRENLQWGDGAQRPACPSTSARMRCMRLTTGTSTSLPCQVATAPPEASTAATMPRACSISAALGAKASWMVAMFEGWIEVLPVNPSARASFVCRATSV
jgi:hypothetical protein